MTTEAAQTALAHIRQAEAISDLIYCLTVDRSGTALGELNTDTLNEAHGLIARELNFAAEALEGMSQPAAPAGVQEAADNLN